MFTLSKLVFLFSFALSATCLTTPHLARSPHHHHHALAARAVPVIQQIHEPGLHPLSSSSGKIRRRGASQRCKARSSSSASSPAGASPTAGASSTVGAPASSPSPLPSSTQSPTPTSTQKSQSGGSTGGSSSSSYLSGTQSGQGTYYAPGLGACGITSSGSDNIVAVSHDLYDKYPGANDANPNTNPVCGKAITATYSGKKVTVTVVDRCQACELTDLDLSPTAFEALAPLASGRIDLQWEWSD